MPVETPNVQPERQPQPVESERGAVVAVLLMVILGVAGIFAVS